jgi:hypothetical protein
VNLPNSNAVSEIGEDSIELTFFFFLISNFRHVLNVLLFLLGNSPASEF